MTSIITIYVIQLLENDPETILKLKCDLNRIFSGRRTKGAMTPFVNRQYLHIYIAKILNGKQRARSACLLWIFDEVVSLGEIIRGHIRYACTSVV